MALKYRTFDELMSSVESDLFNYADENMIQRSKFIKEVRKVNSELGLKINKENETIIQVKDYRAEMPEDFYQLQLALACSTSYHKVPSFRGLHTEAYTDIEELPVKVRCQLNACDSQQAGPCNNTVWITEKRENKIYEHTSVIPLSITKKSSKFCSDNCLNFSMKSPDSIHLEDGYAHFSFREGSVYINYIGDMSDEDGNLLILDHPIVNDYYEYAIKKKFFENAEVNKEGDFLRDYELMKGELREARIRALTFVNTVEYDTIVKVFNENRRKFYNRYIRYFDTGKQGIYSL